MCLVECGRACSDLAADSQSTICFSLCLSAFSPPSARWFCRFEGVIYMNLRSKSEDFGSVKLGEEIGIGEDSYITMVPTHDTRYEETPAGEASTKATLV